MKYLLLMRHGSHGAPTQNSDKPARGLSSEGEAQTREVAERLASVLAEFNDDVDLSISIGAFYYATTPEAVATSNLVAHVLGPHLTHPPERYSALNPSSFRPYRNTGSHLLLLDFLKGIYYSRSDANTILIVGHQPLLGWIAHELLGKTIPISRSELLCLAFEHRGSRWFCKAHLRWVLSPRDDQAIEELKAKIKYKMESAKLLSVFITTALAFLLGSLGDGTAMLDIVECPEVPWYRYSLILSLGLFFGAIGLYLATMYAYDSLLMPVRFWGEAPPPPKTQKRPTWLVWRPPSSAVWILYQNMMRIWRYLFTPATYLGVLGMFFLALAVIKPTWPFEGSFIVGIFMVSYAIAKMYSGHFGAKLGTED